MAKVCCEQVWTEKSKFDEAERIYYEKLAKAALTPLAGEVAKARQRLLEIRNNFQEPADQSCVSSQVTACFEKRLQEFGNVMNAIQDQIQQIANRMTNLENAVKNVSSAKCNTANTSKAPTQSKEEDDDVDLFGSDSEEETEAAVKIREERLAAYNAKKSKKPALIAKSNIMLDVKPWDDTTDMKAIEAAVRKIETDGLLWGAAQLIPLAYGINKLRISCVVEDDKISVDWLQEEIESNDQLVQSVDIAAFNKV